MIEYSRASKLVRVMHHPGISCQPYAMFGLDIAYGDRNHAMPSVSRKRKRAESELKTACGQCMITSFIMHSLRRKQRAISGLNDL